MESIESQNKMLTAHLLGGLSITSLEALNLFGILRLSARIHDLKGKGLNIQKEMISSGKKRFAKYYLNQESK